jgi:hypothetical protein
MDDALGDVVKVADHARENGSLNELRASADDGDNVHGSVSYRLREPRVTPFLK